MVKVVVILSALFSTVAFAAVTPTQEESHNAETVKREYSGFGTYYKVGLGACGHTNNAGQAVVAVSAALYDSSKPCGRKISVQANTGKPAHIATIVDRCTGCAYYDLDMSSSLFQSVVGPLSIGRVPIEWNYV